MTTSRPCRRRAAAVVLLLGAAGCGTGDPDRALRDLERGLRDPDAGVRLRAVIRLEAERLPPETAVRLLMSAAQDAEDDVRKGAVQALGRLGPAAMKAVPLLLRMRNDVGVCHDVENALRRIRNLP